MVDIEFYNIKEGKIEKDLHLLLPPGDLYKICNVLHDYCAILETKIEEDDAYNAMLLMDYIGRLKHIQEKIEEALGYDVAKAIEKCAKKKAKKEDDIGEEALVLASAGGRKKKESSDQKKEGDDHED